VSALNPPPNVVVARTDPVGALHGMNQYVESQVVGENGQSAMPFACS
jgi:hypothetical protein